MSRRSHLSRLRPHRHLSWRAWLLRASFGLAGTLCLLLALRLAFDPVSAAGDDCGTIFSPSDTASASSCKDAITTRRWQAGVAVVAAFAGMSVAPPRLPGDPDYRYD